jgi:hypothetical protein
MADKYLKVIQDGVASYIPDNGKNRTFWAKQNARLGKSKMAQFEMVTIAPATDEEVAFMNQPAITTAPAAPTVTTTELEKMQALFAQQQEQIASQQLLINKLLLGDAPAGSPVKEEPTVTAPATSELEKEKGKPGPKPKTNNDGEANQTQTPL